MKINHLPGSLFAIFIAALISSSTAEGQVIKNWYNGYSPEERDAKLKVANEKLASGELPEASGPCMLCNDPDVPVEYHSEDYGQPFVWGPPGVYTLCKSCHRFRIHTRFRHPDVWQAYLAHVRRGGYARDLRDPAIAAEFKAYRLAIKRGEPAELNPLRPYAPTPGAEWFANLRLDKESLTDPAARLR